MQEVVRKLAAVRSGTENWGKEENAGRQEAKNTRSKRKKGQ